MLIERVQLVLMTNFPAFLTHIILLQFKKGDKADIKNYRPVSILSHVYKIVTKVLRNRPKTELDEQQPREHAGFKEAFSTTDHLHA